MDIGKSFSYPFEDKNWLQKLLIGALVTIVPIVNFAWVGYLVDLLKNVMNHAAEPLPEWTDFGDKFMKGLYVALAGLIYGFPAICLGTIAFSSAVIPWASTSGDTDAMSAAASVFTGVGILVACVIGLYVLALSFFYPAMLIHFSRDEQFGTLFQVGAIIKVATSNLNKYLTAWLIGIVAAFVVSLVVGLVTGVLSFIPCLGWVIGWVLGGLSGVYISVIWMHLFGQVAAEEGPSAVIVS